MKLVSYWKSLSVDGRAVYAEKAGTTPGYIAAHLIPVARKTPKLALIRGLSRASDGKVSHAEVLEHFYPEERDVEPMMDAS